MYYFLYFINILEKISIRTIFALVILKIKKQ